MNSEIPFSEFVRYWLRLGGAHWAGGAAQTARAGRELADMGWVDEAAFLRLREACAHLPGPQGFLLAVCLGRELRGPAGGALAGLLVALPGALALLALSWLLAALTGQALTGQALAGALFTGLSAAGLALALRALWRMGRARLTHPLFWAFAAASLLMGWGLRLKFTGIVIAAALMGLWLGGQRPELFGLGPTGGARPLAGDANALGGWRRAARLTALFAAVWLGLAGAAHLLLGSESILPRLFSLAMRAGLFAFGGAWGVLASMADMAQRQGWITAAEIAPGLGLAAAAPGPLALVLQHAGFLAGWSNPGPMPQAAAGLLGAGLALLGLLLPGGFLALWVAPNAAAFAANPRVRAASIAIGAAMAGVVLKLCLVFGGAFFLPSGLEGGVAWFPVVLTGCGLLALPRLPPCALGPLCVLLALAWGLVAA